MGKWAVDGSRNIAALGVRVPECFHMLSLIFFELKYHLSQTASLSSPNTVPKDETKRQTKHFLQWIATNCIEIT